MKKEELYYLEKKQNEDKIILVKSGNFYYTYSNDAVIMWNIFDYKYDDKKVGFPTNALYKVISKLNRLGLNVIVIKSKNNIIKYNTTIVNDYNNILDTSKNLYDIEKEITSLLNLIYIKIKTNINNLNIINKFIIEL